MNESITKALGFLRERAKPIDGSYLLESEAPFVTTEGLHAAYTPLQMREATWALEKPRVKHVAFLRDPNLPSPIWISPAIFRRTDEGACTVYVVAPSRAQRKTHGREVCIRNRDLAGLKDDERRTFIETQILTTIAEVLGPPVAA